MVGIDPGALLARQHLHLDQPPVVRAKRERLEGQHLPLVLIGRRTLHHRHEILDPDAVGSGLVVARLVGEDHAGLQRHRVRDLGDALRALVDRQVAADAMPGAVVVVEPRLPERLARQRVDLTAGRALGKAQVRKRHMALQHQGVVAAHGGRRLAHRDGPGDVGRAFRKLSAAVQQEEFARTQRAAAFLGHAVVDDRPVRPGPGDRIEAQVPQVRQLAPQRVKPVGDLHLRDRIARRVTRYRVPVDPGQEAGHRRTVAPVRLARALHLGRVLAGLWQKAGIGRALDGRAALGQAVEHPLPRRRRVGQHLRPALPDLLQPRPKALRRLDRHAVPERALERRRHLADIHVPVERGVIPQNRVGEREGRARHVPAPEVQEPGDGFRKGQDRRRDAPLLQIIGEARALLLAALARIGERVRIGGRERGGGPSLPDRVQRVLVQRHQLAARALRPAAQLRRLLRAVKTAVEGELAARPQVLGQPIRRRLLGDMAAIVEFARHLVLELQRVAPVGEDGGAAAQHDRHAGRPGEAGQPGQALGVGRDVLALVLVAARNDEARNAEARQFRAQRREPLGRTRRNPGLKPRGDRLLARLQRVREGGRRRLGDKAHPGIRVFQLGRGQDAFDQGVERRPVHPRRLLGQQGFQRVCLGSGGVAHGRCLSSSLMRQLCTGMS